jgi:hypothetical protein
MEKKLYGVGQWFQGFFAGIMGFIVLRLFFL